MLTPEKLEEIRVKVRAECAAINDALHATRAHGLPVADRLDDAHAVWLETGDKTKAMDALRQAWLESQDALLVVQQAHPGALKYFSDIKDGIKKQVEKGDLPKGYPRPGVRAERAAAIAQRGRPDGTETAV